MYNFQQCPAYPMQPYQPSFYQPKQGTGRVVNSADEITVQEVPTDGTVAYFPLADGSGVIAKKWTADGSIATSQYVLAEGKDTPNPAEDITKKLDEILGFLKEIAE